MVRHTLKSCSKSCKIFKLCLTILGHYALKGYVFNANTMLRSVLELAAGKGKCLIKNYFMLTDYHFASINLQHHNS